MNRPTISPVTARLSGHATSARQLVSELYDLAGRLSHDLHAIPTKRRAAAIRNARGGLPVPFTLEQDPADVRAALEHAHALQALLPAAARLAEAVMGHLEKLDEHHRQQIDGEGPRHDDLPP